jgi:hypothetical protein
MSSLPTTASEFAMRNTVSSVKKSKKATMSLSAASSSRRATLRSGAVLTDTITPRVVVR